MAVGAGVAYRVTSAEDRKRFYAAALDVLRELRAAAAKPRPEYDQFRAALRGRMRYALVTPAIGLVMTLIFARRVLDAGAIDPDTLVAWGASLGTRTTNGEWWRLVTSAFLHDSLLHLLVDIVALIQAGLILERLVGRLTVAAVYVLGGVFAGLFYVSSQPLAVTLGTTSAVFGLYGLLLALMMWQTFHRWRGREVNEHDVIIPPIAMKRLAVGAALFLVYSGFTGRIHAAELTGLLVGAIYGVVFARRSVERQPRQAFVAGATLAALALAAGGAIRIGTITDVKPELAQVLAVEETTAAAYQAQLEALKNGRIGPEALAALTEETIVFKLQAAGDRLKSLENVPAEHQPALADAREYVRLRCASWRARGNAIRRAYAERPRRPEGADDTSWRLQLQARFRSDEAARANAEGAERASREALQRVVTFLKTAEHS